MWFGEIPRGWPASVPLVALLVAGALRALATGLPHLSHPAAETAACIALSVLYRLPALLHPWGIVNRDGAYGAFVALHLLDGTRPAPVFTEGANYQGTLKSHIAALLGLLTGARDASLLMTAASLFLYLVFVVASIALARRVGGRAAGLAAGLYLAVGPRFLTVFSLNCVGQYVDVLALGGVALAILGGMLAQGTAGAAARGPYLALGLLLGAAFWQQPVALCYVVVALVTLALRRETWRDPWAGVVLLGLVLGVAPMLLWNIEHAWASGDILGRDPGELRAQAIAIGRHVRRTIAISFPILAGLSPEHPWAEIEGIPLLAASIPLVSLGGYVVLKGRTAADSLRRLRPSPVLLPPLLALVCLAIFWTVAAGRVYWRPRYLLPVVAATAINAGVIAAWLWTRSHVGAGAFLGVLLALNASGAVPRLRASAAIAAPYRRLVESLQEKGIRTGYSDFSLSAPVTMFTAEKIVLSPRLGPTPAYESEHHARLVDEQGPDAYVLLAEDDPEQFADVLRKLGVAYRVDLEPVPVFYGFSRRVRLDEVAGFRGPENEPARRGAPEEQWPAGSYPPLRETPSTSER